MGEKFRLDITVDKKIAAQSLQESQASARKRHVQLHLEGRRGQHHTADVGCIVVHPGGNQHRADTLGDHGDILYGKGIFLRDVIDKVLHITH